MGLGSAAAPKLLKEVYSIHSKYNNDEYETAKSSWLAPPSKQVRITATLEEIIVEDTCLKFDDDQWGSWNAPNFEAITASNCKALEAEQIKEIHIPVYNFPKDEEIIGVVKKKKKQRHGKSGVRFA